MCIRRVLDLNSTTHGRVCDPHLPLLAEPFSCSAALELADFLPRASSVLRSAASSLCRYLGTAKPVPHHEHSIQIEDLRECFGGGSGQCGAMWGDNI